MSAVRSVRLWCDWRAAPTETAPHGWPCPAEFCPTLSTESIVAARREAGKSGWTYIRHPDRTLSILDKDYCPKHKPEENGR